MFYTLFPDIRSEEARRADIEAFVLYGAWACCLATLFSVFFPSQSAYDLSLFLSISYISISWMQILHAAPVPIPQTNFSPHDRSK